MCVMYLNLKIMKLYLLIYKFLPTNNTVWFYVTPDFNYPIVCNTLLV